MAILKTTLGYYIPTFFEMHVATHDDNMIINQMSDGDATVLFHEYIHFLQDITTFYGLNNLYVQSEYLHSVVNRVKGNLQFQVPYMIRDNKDNVLLNQKICRLTNGDSEESSFYLVHSVDEWSDDLADDFISNPPISEIKNIVLNQNDNMRSFGAIAIMESMAYILERLCSPNAYVSSPDYPYRAAELVAIYYDAKFGNDLLRVLALCDMSLQNSNPGLCFVNIMKLVGEGKLQFDTPESIYDYFYNRRVKSVYGRVTSWQDSYNKLLDQVDTCLQDYIKGIDSLKSYHEWINHLVDFSRDWRNNDRYFLLKMARKNDLKKNDCWGYAVARIGSPLMVNANNHYFKLPYDGMQEGESVEMYAALKEIYKLFLEGNKPCGLLTWCNDSLESTPNELCNTAPWKKVGETKLCPYAFFWRHWGLTGCEPV